MSRHDRREHKKDKSPPHSDAWKKSSNKKNTKKWCKGVVGREHISILVEEKWYSSQNLFCSPRAIAFPWMKITNTKLRWFCIHQQKCAACNKILNYNLRIEQCPVYIDTYGLED